MQTPFLQIDDAGTSILHQPPAGTERPDIQPGSPLRVAVYHDLTIELRGPNSVTKTQLTPDAVCGLIGLLNFVLRDHLHDKKVH
ncbi:MAG: hypothetical protein C0445_13785 [Polaromonas sp.]|nr:hypothetical protein [Polaromonas sp.]